jgi:hypothetical protein
MKHVSATSIAAFKTCPVKFRLGYVEGIREAVEPAPFRFGTAWHKGLEVLEAPDGSVVLTSDPDAGLLGAAIEAATSVYTTIPDYADPTEWAVEREVVANGLAAYHWLYGSALSEYETAAVELEFDLPLVNPETGHATPNFRRVGKIDRIIRHKASGRLLIQENKSTSKPIDSGSTYWARLRKDTQSKFYICAARDLQDEGKMVSEPNHTSMVSGLLHDVFRKPAIRPSKLTMAESKAFVETGEYCGQKFKIVRHTGAQLGFPDDPIGAIFVDEVRAEVEPGKKEGTFALRETPGMYGARLFQDMTTRPEYYFARREIAFTDAELEDFRYQVWALQRTMAEMEKSGHWYENEQQCEATYKCCYCNLCYNNQVETVCDGVTVPPGYRRLRAETVESTPTGETE